MCGSCVREGERRMNELHFSSEEIDVLRELLRHVITDMDVEVFRTDTRDFKDKLKHRRDILEHILNRIDSMPVPA